MMRAQVADLLAVMQTYDSRTVGETDVIAWHGVVGDLQFDECRDAVIRHYSDSTDRAMPAHIRKRALAARQDAAMRELPDAGPVRALSAGADFNGLPIPGKPAWAQGVYEAAKARQREINAERKANGQLPTFGSTVMASNDGRIGR